MDSVDRFRSQVLVQLARCVCGGIYLVIMICEKVEFEDNRARIVRPLTFEVTSTDPSDCEEPEAVIVIMQSSFSELGEDITRELSALNCTLDEEEQATLDGVIQEIALMACNLQVE